MLFRKKGRGPPPAGPPAGPAGGPPEEEGGHPAEPAFKDAMNLLNSERYDEAIMAFQRLQQQYPDFEPSTVAYGLGVAYDSKGIMEQAEWWLRESIRMNVQNFEAHIFLGNVYAKLGRHTDAIAEYTFVIENNPDHELAPGLRAQVLEMQSFSADGARTALVEEVEAFRMLVKKQFNIDLSYDLKGIAVLNMIMDTGWNDTVLAGSFIGEVIVRTLGGGWHMRMPREASTIEGLAGMRINPFEMAAKKVERGKELDLVAHMKAIQSRLG